MKKLQDIFGGYVWVISAYVGLAILLHEVSHG